VYVLLALRNFIHFHSALLVRIPVFNDTTMKAVLVPSIGASAEVRSDIDVPEPSDTQLLVKCIYTAINPVDAFMANMGLLVESWPLVPGCDAAGVVVKAGKDAESALGGKFKDGGEVFGCTRLGQRGHGAWQEYVRRFSLTFLRKRAFQELIHVMQFLMDAVATIPKPKSLNFAQACATGVGILTAFEGVFNTLNLPLLDPENLPDGRDEWVLVFGGASTVGKFAVQALKLSGYKVVTTCSAKSIEVCALI